MSEIPIQAPTRGAHEAEEDDYYPAAEDYDPAEIDAVADDDTVSTPAVADDEVDLSSDPFADDLSEQLAAAAPKRWANRATLVIGALALAVGGFLGGVQVQKHFGSTGQNARSGVDLSNLANGANRGGFNFPGGGTGGTGTNRAGGTGAGSGGGSAAATTSGTVKLVDGTTLYVQLANGDVVTVKTTDSTKVSIASPGKLSGLKQGEKVTVTGPAPGSDGTMTASAVTGTP